MYGPCSPPCMKPDADKHGMPQAEGGQAGRERKGLVAKPKQLTLVDQLVSFRSSSHIWPVDA